MHFNKIKMTEAETTKMDNDKKKKNNKQVNTINIEVVSLEPNVPIATTRTLSKVSDASSKKDKSSTQKDGNKVSREKKLKVVNGFSIKQIEHHIKYAIQKENKTSASNILKLLKIMEKIEKGIQKNNQMVKTLINTAGKIKFLSKDNERKHLKASADKHKIINSVDKQSTEKLKSLSQKKVSNISESISSTKIKLPLKSHNPISTSDVKTAKRKKVSNNII